MRALTPFATITGFCCLCVGVGLTFGVGVALMCGGAVLFVAGGVAESRAGR